MKGFLKLGDKNSFYKNFIITVLKVVYFTVHRKSMVIWLIFTAQRNKSASLIFAKKLAIIRNKVVIKNIYDIENNCRQIRF